MSARSVEALELLSKGFNDLKTSEPALAYSVLVNIIAGLHE